MLWCCIKMLGREYPQRASPLAELPQRSSQVVDVVADQEFAAGRGLAILPGRDR